MQINIDSDVVERGVRMEYGVLQQRAINPVVPVPAWTPRLSLVTLELYERAWSLELEL